MNDTNQQTTDTTAPPADGSPTRQQRLDFIHNFQTQALARSDPLAANLGVIAADLMGFAHGLAATVQVNLLRGPPSAERHQRLIRDAELYLKFVRQIDRLAQLERQLGRSGPAKEPVD